MSQGMLLTLSTVLVLLSVTIAVFAWMSSLRWTREYREALDQTAAAKDEAIRGREGQLEGKEETLTALREEVELLREMDSVRFADRYLETKSGLEQRLHRLETRRDRWKARLEEEQGKLAELELSSEQKAEEIQQLRSELTKNQLDSRTLDEALQTVSSLGEIPVSDLRSALARRRRRQAEVTARLEQLTLDGDAKSTEMERLNAEIERARKEVEVVEREIEITRAAGPILDSLLGVTAEMKDRLGAVEERLERSMRSLSRAPGRDPIADFLDATAGASRERNLLLAAGAVPPVEEEGRNGAQEEASLEDGESPEGEDVSDSEALEAGTQPAETGIEAVEPVEVEEDAEQPDEARVVREAYAASRQRTAGSLRDDSRREE